MAGLNWIDKAGIGGIGAGTGGVEEVFSGGGVFFSPWSGRNSNDFFELGRSFLFRGRRIYFTLQGQKHLWAVFDVIDTV